jgi:hypothetical protein
LQKTITNFATWYVLRYGREVERGKEPDTSVSPRVAMRVRTMLGYTGSDLAEEHLYFILDTFRYARATNLRDKVYGLLGIHTKVSRMQTIIEVDYRKTVAEIYIETVLQTILRTGRLHILSYLGHNTALRGSEFSSWEAMSNRDIAFAYGRVALQDSGSSLLEYHMNMLRLLSRSQLHLLMKAELLAIVQ